MTNVRETAVVFIQPFLLGLSKNHGEPSVYGVYTDYVSKIDYTYYLVKNNSIPSIYIMSFEEDKGILMPKQRRWPPFSNSLIFEWTLNIDKSEEKSRESNNLNRIVMNNGAYMEMQRFQNLDQIAESIKSYGFKRIIVCGETGPYQNHCEGYAGIIARILFKQGIKVNGLKEGVFPLIPQGKKFINYWKSEGFMTKNKFFSSGNPEIKQKIQELRNATHILYEDTVNLEDLIKPTIVRKKLI